ncbi:MAG: hypothetical protein SR1Q5_08665 [Quinella sp. 1Q5]|nr:hypothetical protein [Quinella sp. 1Q5]
MKINIDALKILELKLAEYSKVNGSIAEHKLVNAGCTGCSVVCGATCTGNCSGHTRPK